MSKARRRKDPNKSENTWQKILEEVLYDAYDCDGTSFMASDRNWGCNNLFSFMASKVRNYVLNGGDVMRTDRAVVNRRSLPTRLRNPNRGFIRKEGCCA